MTNSSRMVLVGVGLGLIIMLGNGVYYRFTEAAAVKQNAPAAAQRGNAPASTSASVAPGADAAAEGMARMEQARAEDPQRAAMIGAMQKLQANGQDMDALLSLTGLFIAQEDWVRAEDFARRALVADPANALASYYLGVILANNEIYGEAVENLERSITLQDTAQARFSLAVVYRYHLNDPVKAKEHLEKAATNPGITEALRPLVQQELAELNKTQAPQ